VKSVYERLRDGFRAVVGPQGARTSVQSDEVLEDPDDARARNPEMDESLETIYLRRSVQCRGVLKKALVAHREYQRAPPAPRPRKRWAIAPRRIYSPKPLRQPLESTRPSVYSTPVAHLDRTQSF
jgi:hypothetical protein